MKCPVIVKFIRSDNKTLIVDGTDWILPNDGLDGFGEVSNDLSAVDKSVGDGSVLVSKRVNSIDREIKAVVTDKRLNQTLRYKATSFFNGKFSFKIFVTYMGRTRWCDGEIRKFFCPSENIYDKVYFSVTFFCANPFMKSEEDFGKNIAGVTPMVAFPYLCGLKTGEYKTTKSGKEITISGENTRIDAIQVHGQSEQNSYSGKNLLENTENPNYHGKFYGIDININECGVIEMYGTSTGQMVFNLTKDLDIPSNKQLILSGCLDGSGSTYMLMITYLDENNKWKSEEYQSKKDSPYVIKTSNPSFKKYRIAVLVRKSVQINTKFYPQIELGTSATSYEPYVGAKPSPSPDYPQEIVSKPTKIESNGANGEKSVANILTPLCGIKVASGGNYTDENGQQWITDEIVKNADGSGTYVKRIEKVTFDGSEDEDWRFDRRTEEWSDINIFIKAPNTVIFPMVNRFTKAKNSHKPNVGEYVFYSNNAFEIYLEPNQITDIITGRAWLSEHNVIVHYALKTPQEIPLTSEQLAQFSNLKTYSPHCVISNDGNIPMNLQYVTIVGGKKHIEGRPTGRFDFARKVELHNDGDVEAYCKAIFVAKGEVTNPKLIINGKYVRVITTMHSDDVLVIDFTKDPPTVRLNGKNIIGQTDRTSNFDGMQLNIGDSEIGYDADTGTGLLDVSIYYNKLYNAI